MSSKTNPAVGTMSGLLLVDKERGYTSHDIVRIARKALGQRKIGHCGTLDPEATGLLILTVGRGTRLTRFLIRAPKVYEGAVQLGASTDTYDAAGEIVRRGSTEGVTMERVREVMAGFEGTYEQIPPPYCAKKINGEKYYELARRGEEVPKESKPVQVFEFSPICDSIEGDVITFRLGCSSGTYARSLAHDLGETLGCGGHLCALRRVKIGNFELERACTLEALEGAERDPVSLGDAWIPFDEIPLPFADVEADSQQERRIQHGQTMIVPGLGGEEGDWVKVMNGRHEFIAVGTVVESYGDQGVGVIQPKIVFK